MIDKRIGIIGCGNMGEALLGRLSESMEKSTSLMVSEMDSARRDYIRKKYRMIVEIDNNLVVKGSDVIILAIKPKDFEDVLKGEVSIGASDKKLIISIAAGITTRHIESVIGPEIPVVRVMPNMPAIIGEAVSAICAGSSADKKHMDTVREIFSMIGDVVEVEEKLMNAVTAVSGTGPAYFFYLMETLIKSAVSLGLDKKAARELVVKTALGSAKLISELEADPEEMREKVTSKGGTTEAAFKVFKARRMDGIIKAAVKKASDRSRKLSKG